MARDSMHAVLAEIRPAIIRFVVARGAAPSDAEDVVQELFIKLGDLPLELIADPRAYIYRIAHNLLLDRHRASTRRIQREVSWTAAQAGQLSEQSREPSIEQVLIDREQLKVVTDALNELPVRTVEIFRRYRVDGQSQKVIASDIGISVSAVEKHLQRAYRVVLDAKQRLAADLAEPRRQGTKDVDRGG